MTSATPFEPGLHLTRIKGQDYLEVKWRIAWLRSEFPEATVATELVSHDGVLAVFRAEVELPNGGKASGYGSERSDVFPNYIEKAETKAIGRALAALGFGTQFCVDFDDGVIADAPVAPRPTPIAPEMDRMTVPQRTKIQGMARSLRMDARQLDTLVREQLSKSIDELSKRDASRLIDHLTTRLGTADARQVS